MRPRAQWRRDRWMRILETHAAMPYGEDAWIGSDAISNDERIAAELRCWVRTYAPSRLLPACGCGTGAREQGYGASSIWKQRALRWYTNAPRRLLIRVAQLVHYQAGSISRNAWFRAFMLFHIVQVVSNVLMPVYLVHTALSSPMAAMQTLRHLVFVLGAFRYLKSLVVASFVSWRDPELRARALTLLAYPFYLLFLDVCFVYGHWRSLTYYNPFFPLQRHMPRKWIAEHADVVQSGGALVMIGAEEESMHSSTSSLSEMSLSRPKEPVSEQPKEPLNTLPRHIDTTKRTAAAVPVELKAVPAEEGAPLEGITVVKTPRT